MNKYEALKKYFGYDSFRYGQEELADSILSGRDTLGVMPTGAGKSLCYQVPALISEGITVVISPLISLMKDQVMSLTDAGVSAAYINSSLSASEFYAVMRNASAGMYKLLYVAPERLENETFMDFAMKADISAVTVDEAHCISQWGQDFRPSYLNIPKFTSALPKRPVISAFTATATENVRRDIVRLLEMQTPFSVVTGFDRKNLYFEVRTPSDKLHELISLVKKYSDEDRSGIIYCSTRKTVEAVCDKLRELGFSAARYHAGLSEEERRTSQEDFIYDRVKIMAATNAFGMGIDKSNVSFVIHYNMPKDLESYYQEAGRAGRDGSPSDCILLYSGQDIITAKFLINKSFEESELDADMAERVRKQDLYRLNVMAGYCRQSECLRGYILRYFGEKASGGCGNCSYCCCEDEMTDITVDAQKIMSCIYRVEQRYGEKMIRDILRGSAAKKILSLGLDKLSTYGIMKDCDEKRLSLLISRLEGMGYIVRTEGEYPVLRLGNGAGDVLRGKKSVFARLPAAQKHETVKVYEYDPKLMDMLRSVRQKHAQIQGIPAYMVFSDTSLREMCVKLPRTDSEFRQISGVGSAKQERYGRSFLDAINSYVIQNFPKAAQVTKRDNTARSLRKASAVKNGFAEIRRGLDKVTTTEDIHITGFCDSIIVSSGADISNSALRKAITGWLESIGALVTLKDENGHAYKQVTDSSDEIGIYSEIVQSASAGRTYVRVKYKPSAQQFILDNLDAVEAFAVQNLNV
ncbi:MAG: DNA helicase RecQ [Huintestinicola sp.]